MLGDHTPQLFNACSHSTVSSVHFSLRWICSKIESSGEKRSLGILSTKNADLTVKADDLDYTRWK